MIVTVVVAGVPSVAQLGLLSVTEKVSFASLTKSVRMATVKVLSAVSPSAQASVPLVAV